VFSVWMPWKEQRAMSLKLQFVERAVVKGSNLTELVQPADRRTLLHGRKSVSIQVGFPNEGRRS
jgi:hypothetical protein